MDVGGGDQRMAKWQVDVGGGRSGEGRGIERWCGAGKGVGASAGVDTGVGVGGIICAIVGAGAGIG